MKNTLLESGGRYLMLTVTEAARSAGLVDESSEDEVTTRRRAKCFTFDDFVLYFSYDHAPVRDMIDVGFAVAKDTDSLHRVEDVKVMNRGPSYQLHIPGGQDAGFTEGEKVWFDGTDGLVAIADPVGREAGPRLWDDVKTMWEDR